MGIALKDTDPARRQKILDIFVGMSHDPEVENAAVRASQARRAADALREQADRDKSNKAAQEAAKEAKDAADTEAENRTKRAAAKGAADKMLKKLEDEGKLSAADLRYLAGKGYDFK
jgi:hypothetical protein